MKVNENGRNFLIFGRLFSSRSQNYDVLSSFCGRKNGRLDVVHAKPFLCCYSSGFNIHISSYYDSSMIYLCKK